MIIKIVFFFLFLIVVGGLVYFVVNPIPIQLEDKTYKNCYVEENLPVVDGAKCCEGQTRIGPKDEGIVGSSVCTAKCGNFICDIELESGYNCARDCK